MPLPKTFEVTNPDFELSPHTGMTRQHYVNCARYVLERAFTHVKSFDQPIIFPLVPGKSYPQPEDPAWRTRSFEFEALERTFNLAAPLIHEDPEVAINGIKLREYYCHHFYNALTPGHSNSLPLPDELPDATYQFTCEFGGWTKTLLLMPETFWPWLSKEQQDDIAVTISKWAHHRTTQNNWRLFNICALSFLKKNGYEIDDDLLKSHLMWIASYHAGNGWYLEQSYNYYTISLFVVYGTIWNRMFGDEHYPAIAAVLENSFNELFDTYPRFFGRDGYINMWARSICYRLWISGGFPVSFLLKGGSPIDPGWARRLCSGSLLQFVGREDFFENDIPSLGFYGHREFAIQNYSCPASPFIMFLPFIALALPQDSPFWTAKENDGIWTELGARSERTILEKPGLALVNHGSTGTSEIVSGKVYDDDHNYSKLVFNTHFPWEDHNPAGGTSQEYSFHSLDPRDLSGVDINFYLTGRAVDNSASAAGLFTTSQSILFNGNRNGVLYRQLLMRKPPNNGVGYIIDLAEITIPGGVLRVDRCRMAFEHELTLGHFGLPHMGGQPARVERFQEPFGQAQRTVMTAAIPGRQLAMITYSGWDDLTSKVHSGFNAEAEDSTVLYAYRKRVRKNPAMELMVSVMLHKTDDTPWTADELAPVRELDLKEVMPSGSVIGAELTLADGSHYTVDFVDIDGYKSC